MEPLRLLLVDDHVLFRRGIVALLAERKDITVIGEANDGLEAVKMAQQLLPDVILMDVNMPRQNGLETVKIIKRELPYIQIVMLTVSDDDHDLFEAIKNGARGYLLKDLEPRELYAMLDRLRQGEAPISGVMAAKILQEFGQPAQKEKEVKQPLLADELTSREREVLDWVVTGASNKEIADALHVTENTIKIHLRNILEKLHVQNRIQAAVYAVRQGLIDKGEKM
jgi:DNA-binding NarL/FixJ family response regulator